MGRIGVILIAAALALTACSGAAETGPTTETGSPGGEADDRAVAVYSAVIRRLVTNDHTFGARESPFERVYVDARIDDPPWDTARPHAGKALSVGVRAAILRELADLPPVRFVEDPDPVIVGEKQCAHVKGNGVLITLGTISDGDDRLTVPSGMFIACLAGRWGTYVLERTGAGWRVVGNKGPLVIS